MELTGALESLLKPLKLFRIPVEDIAMILSVAIQFIPTLSEEADMIKKAQTARGARFESRRLTDVYKRQVYAANIIHSSLAQPVYLLFCFPGSAIFSHIYAHTVRQPAVAEHICGRCFQGIGSVCIRKAKRRHRMG